MFVSCRKLQLVFELREYCRILFFEYTQKATNAKYMGLASHRSDRGCGIEEGEYTPLSGWTIVRAPSAFPLYTHRLPLLSISFSFPFRRLVPPRYIPQYKYASLPPQFPIPSSFLPPQPCWSESCVDTLYELHWWYVDGTRDRGALWLHR